ncbi:MAG: hypothetical protein OET90_02405 [Desulfuromonadales bacterium]|nr:hypothetical protein [Desulfuromonadales bacterium]
METLINQLLFRGFRLDRWLKKFLQTLQTEAAEGFLQVLLNVMRLAFLVSPDYRRNIKHFEARYQFKSQEDGLAVAAEFRSGKMTVTEGCIASPTIIVNFKNSKALMSFLLAPKPDILNSILHQEITLKGNLNYLYKFAYMSKRLQLMALGQA